jgi:hypothetical protein
MFQPHFKISVKRQINRIFANNILKMVNPILNFCFLTYDKDF